jgi:MoxR-like ATPase
VKKFLEIDGNPVIGFFRSSVDGDLKVAMGQPACTFAWQDVPMDVQGALIAHAVEVGQNLKGDDWYLDVSGGVAEQRNEGDDQTPGDAQGDGDCPECDGTGQGRDEYMSEDCPECDGTGKQQGDQGDNNNDDAGDPGDDDGEGEQPEQEGDEMNFDDRNKNGEDESTGNQMVDDIWKLIKPNVEAVSANHTTYGVDFVFKNLPEFSPGTPGEPEPYKAPKFEGPKAPKPAPGKLQHKMYPKLLNMMARRVHPYLSGPPGTGKSQMAKEAADELGLAFSVTSFSPMSTESKLLGYRDANGVYIRTDFRDRYEFGGVWLGDEMDNANGAVVAVMNGGLAQDFMGFPDGNVDRHPDFICIATANTWGTGPTAEFAGRQKMDAATLNRFVKMGIETDEDLEFQIVSGILGDDLATTWLAKVRHVRSAVAELRIKTFVTMRDSINGARLIQPGPGKFSQAEAIEMTCMCLLTDDQKRKVKAWKPGKGV